MWFRKTDRDRAIEAIEAFLRDEPEEWRPMDGHTCWVNEKRKITVGHLRGFPCWVAVSPYLGAIRGWRARKGIGLIRSLLERGSARRWLKAREVVS